MFHEGLQKIKLNFGAEKWDEKYGFIKNIRAKVELNILIKHIMFKSSLALIYLINKI